MKLHEVLVRLIRETGLTLVYVLSSTACPTVLEQKQTRCTKASPNNISVQQVVVCFVSPRMSLLVRVIRAMEELAPLALSKDHTWDNVGLLLEAPRPMENASSKVLLTIDFTKAVLEECLGDRVSCVVAYHPLIFNPIKRLTLANPGHELILRCIQNGISVYSPHTALDACQEGSSDKPALTRAPFCAKDAFS